MADQTCYLTQSQCTDDGPATSGTGPMTPDACWIITVTDLTRLGKASFDLPVSQSGGGGLRSLRLGRLVGLVVRRPPRERKIPGSNPAGIFSGSSHTSDLKIGTPVATLPGARRYRVNTGTGRPGVSILWLGEVERLICKFYLNVAARTTVSANPSLRYTSLLLGR